MTDWPLLCPEIPGDSPKAWAMATSAAGDDFIEVELESVSFLTKVCAVLESPAFLLVWQSLHCVGRSSFLWSPCSVGPSLMLDQWACRNRRVSAGHRF